MYYVSNMAIDDELAVATIELFNFEIQKVFLYLIAPVRNITFNLLFS